MGKLMSVDQVAVSGYAIFLEEKMIPELRLQVETDRMGNECGLIACSITAIEGYVELLKKIAAGTVVDAK